MKRVLIYSHDTFGLGNMRRMLEGARHESSAEVSVLVVTGSLMLRACRIPPRLVDLYTSVWRNGRSPKPVRSSASQRELPTSFISREKSWQAPISFAAVTLAC